MADMVEPASRRYVSQRLMLNYLDWGNPGAPVLLLIHGGQDHARSWDRVVRLFRDTHHVICPDLRGHGDSAWSPEGNYSMPSYVFDLAELIHQYEEEPVSIVGHSLGGAVALRYAGLYPERVRRLAAIEGLGISPLDHKPGIPVDERWRAWIERRRALTARTPRRYATLDQACVRMAEENPHLSADLARHLTVHGLNRNEDGSYSWKFDNLVRSDLPVGLADEELNALWHNIDCAVWLVHGADSWAQHPAKDGRAEHFKRASVTSYERAGHWLHHDRFDSFAVDLRTFLQ